LWFIRRGNSISANLRAGVVQVELASTRDVDVTRGLVRAGVKVEGDHESTNINRGVDVLATIGVRNVLVEEGSRDVAVEGHAVSLNAQLVNGGGQGLEGGLALGARESRLNLRLGGSHGARETAEGREAVAGEGSIELVNSEDSRAGNAESSSEVQSKTSEADESSSVVSSSDGARGQRAGEAVAVLEAAEINLLGSSLAVQVPAVKQLGRSRVNVLSGTETDVDGLNGPLKLVEEQIVVGLVDTDDLLAVNADEREADTLDEDIVDLRVHEDVVDVELAEEDIRNRDGVGGGSIQRGILSMKVLEDVLGGSQSKGDETLTVGDGHGGDSKARVLVEPEDQRDPEVKLGLNRLGGLRTVGELEELTDTSTTPVTARDGVAVDIGVTLKGYLLANIAVPTNLLVGGNEELLVEVENLRVVLIQRVTVDIELNLLAEGLTQVVNVSKELTTLSGVSSGISPVISIQSGDGAKLDVEHHIMEEVTELGNRESNLSAETSRAGLS
jgi:hypothetical protein